VFVDWFNQVWKRWPNGIEEELDRPEPDTGAIRAHSTAMANALDRFETMLAGRDHLMGDEFSAADCCAFPFLKFALLRDPDDDELFHRILEEHQRLGDDHPRLADWIRRVDERPRA
jgi:glutathione S-transferase